MRLDIAGKVVEFRNAQWGENLDAPFVLPNWAGYESENSHPGFVGEHVRFVLQSPTKIESSDLDHYRNLINWFLENQPTIQARTLAALTQHVIQIKHAYSGARDEELDAFRDPRQLKSMVDLYLVRFHDALACSEPSFGLEFDCNWDPEHGCGVLFEGLRVDDIGGGYVAQGP